MCYRCLCGAQYRISPKEVPLARDEIILCECGRLIQGKHGTRYFDYDRLTNK